MIMMMNLMMTIMFMFMNHPLSMGMILLMQTIIISLMSGMYSYTYWFSYILFLIMLGGMLILFIYMTSLASNEMFKFSMKLTMMFMTMMMLSIMLLMMLDYMMMIPMYKNSNMFSLINMLKNENIKSMNMIYNNPNNMITLMLMNYLFLTLIAVVKITNINYGPLRQKF
uniref:NADH dehydrogenase subunit 6 n=1 Tax=Bembidion laterale TaxID=931411 RepID=UPI0030027600|nr:NADH dehydrogenase subunit 6 [Bembidion laterale]